MRRLLATGAIAAVVAFGAACGDDSDNSDPEQAQEPTGNTAEVCADAETVQSEQVQGLNEDLTALQEQDLPEEEFEQAALVRMEEALVDWSDALHEQADRAEDPELTEALGGLADGLADAAPQLTVESVRTGEIPGSEELNAYGQTLTEICAPEAPATP